MTVLLDCNIRKLLDWILDMTKIQAYSGLGAAVHKSG